jgi:hypothetical protein
MNTRPVSLLRTLIDPVTLGVLIALGLLPIAYPALVLRLAWIVLLDSYER